MSIGRVRIVLVYLEVWRGGALVGGGWKGFSIGSMNQKREAKR